jgi:hypothetical protein
MMSSGSKKSARARGGGKGKPRLVVPEKAEVLWVRPFEILSVPYSSKKLHMFRPVLVGHEVRRAAQMLKRVYVASQGLWCPNANKVRHPREGSRLLLKAMDGMHKLPHEEGTQIFIKSMSVELGCRRRPGHAIRHARMRSFGCQSRYSHLKFEVACIKE